MARVVLPAPEHDAQARGQHVQPVQLAVAQGDALRGELGDPIQAGRLRQGLVLQQLRVGVAARPVDRARAGVEHAQRLVAPGGLQHVDRAQHVGGDDGGRIALLALEARGDHGGMHHARDLVGAEHGVHRGRVAHVALHRVQRAGQGGEQRLRGRGRRGEGEVHHLLAALEQLLQHVQADEAGAAGHQHGHLLPPVRNGACRAHSMAPAPRRGQRTARRAGPCAVAPMG